MNASLILLHLLWICLLVVCSAYTDTDLERACKTNYQPDESSCKTGVCAGSFNFQIRWVLKEADFTSFINLDPVKTFTFTHMENLTFEVRLEGGREYHDPYYIALMPACSKTAFIKHALVYGTDKIFSLKKEKELVVIPTSRLLQGDFRDNKEKVVQNGTVPVYLSVIVYTDIFCVESYFATSCRNVFSCNNEGTQNWQDDYHYSGSVPHMSVERALIALAKHNVRHVELQRISIEYLKDHLTPENVIGILELAIYRNIKDLAQKCVEYLKTLKNMEQYKTSCG